MKEAKENTAVVATELDLHNPSKEQIAAWKQENKCEHVFMLSTEDDKIAWIKDPLSDLNVMKLAFTAMKKSTIEFVKTILENCWIAGDESVKTDEKYCNFLADEVQEITDIPECIVRREDSKFIMTVGGNSCEVRMAMRADINKAEQRNAAKEPFETAINLLSYIALKPEEVENIRKTSTRSYIGLLVGVEKVKNKAFVQVSKF
jgi:hypothetical protein